MEQSNVPGGLTLTLTLTLTQAAIPSERRQTLEYLLEIIERSLPDVRIRVSYPYP